MHTREHRCKVATQVLRPSRGIKRPEPFHLGTRRRVETPFPSICVSLPVSEMRLTIGNYKSIAHANLDLRPGLNVLIGPNGSGKTCLLSSLKFLRDAFRLGVAQALARQGGARRVYRHGSNTMSF